MHILNIWNPRIPTFCNWIICGSTEPTIAMTAEFHKLQSDKSQPQELLA